MSWFGIRWRGELGLPPESFLFVKAATSRSSSVNEAPLLNLMAFSSTIRLTMGLWMGELFIVNSGDITGMLKSIFCNVCSGTTERRVVIALSRAALSNSKVLMCDLRRFCSSRWQLTCASKLSTELLAVCSCSSSSWFCRRRADCDASIFCQVELASEGGEVREEVVGEEEVEEEEEEEEMERGVTGIISSCKTWYSTS